MKPQVINEERLAEIGDRIASQFHAVLGAVLGCQPPTWFKGWLRLAAETGGRAVLRELGDRKAGKAGKAGKTA